MSRDARRPHRRFAPVPLVVFAALLVVPLLLSMFSDGSDEPGPPPTSASSTSAPGASVPIEPADVRPGPSTPPTIAEDVQTYRIVYRSEAFGPGGSVLDTVTHEVRRPFHARVETLVGAPPGDERSSLEVHGFGYTEVGARDQVRTPTVNEPTLPVGDVGVLADLDDVSDRGLLRYLAQERTVAGRECHRYRTGTTVDVAVLVEPTPSDFADLCVDAAGLVLAETWVVDGSVLRRREAVEVHTGIEVDDDRFAPMGEAPAVADGGGLLVPVTDDSMAPGVDHWWLPAPPTGLAHRGRFGFAAPTTHSMSTDEPGTRIAGLVDVFQSGPDAVMVVNGGSSDRSDVIGEPDGEVVDLGELGDAVARRRNRGSELLVRLDRGRFVRVHGTVPLDELLTLARQLVRHPASEDSGVVRLQAGEELFGPTTTAPTDGDGPGHDHGDSVVDGHDHGDGEVDDHSHDNEHGSDDIDG